VVLTAFAGINNSGFSVTDLFDMRQKPAACWRSASGILCSYSSSLGLTGNGGGGWKLACVIGGAY
jgi:hypothetical protein